MGGEIINNSNYTCCFCNIFIQSSFSDPCMIDILINFNKPKNQQYNQLFYCHMICFKKQLSTDMQNYFYLESLIESKHNVNQNDE